MSSHQRSKYSSVSLEHPKASLWFPAAAPKAIWPGLIGLLVTWKRRGFDPLTLRCETSQEQRRSTPPQRLQQRSTQREAIRPTKSHSVQVRRRTETQRATACTTTRIPTRRRRAKPTTPGQLYQPTRSRVIAEIQRGKNGKPGGC